ncbi:hypothetical protein RYX36_009879 [Vicia faba]
MATRINHLYLFIAIVCIISVLAQGTYEVVGIKGRSNRVHCLKAPNVCPTRERPTGCILLCANMGFIFGGTCQGDRCCCGE